MSSQKVTYNLKQFEKKISNAIIGFLTIAILITTILFIVIHGQANVRQNILRTKNIDTAINLFQSNLSEKISIIASSNLFIDFLTSGSVTQKELEPLFLTELLPLKLSGIVGYTLKNSETHSMYHSGDYSDQFVSLKLCYIADRLDSKNGNCFGTLQLFFSGKKLIENLTNINSAIKPCSSCSIASFSKNSYFGNFIIESQQNFGTRVTIDSQNENIYYYYFIIISILVWFALFNRIKLRNMLNKTISHPFNLLIHSIKDQANLTKNPDALYEINYLAEQIEAWKKQIEKIQDIQKEAAIGQLAAQVVHDIRSPLLVLNLEAKNIVSVSENKRIAIRNAIQRVNDIANNLLSQYKQNKISTAEGLTFNGEPISIMLESIVSEKRMQVSNTDIRIELDSCQDANMLFVKVDISGFKRVISNIIDNSIEAINNNGLIIVKLTKISKKIMISVNDNGCGIPKDRLPLIFEPGVSFDKVQGSGLGLSYAANKIHSWNAAYAISSKMNEGTTFEIIFPEGSAPAWISSCVTISKNATIIILDDDEYIHNIWKQKFSHDFIRENNLVIMHFHTPEELENHCRSQTVSISNSIFLLDYEFAGHKMNGLSLAETLGIISKAILVTSRYEDDDVREDCQRFGMKILPKSFVMTVPIIITCLFNDSITN